MLFTGVIERIELTPDDGVGVTLRPDAVEHDEFPTFDFVSVLLWTGVVARVVFFNVTPCWRPMGADADCLEWLG